jgi:hypothetical protein
MHIRPFTLPTYAAIRRSTGKKAGEDDESASDEEYEAIELEAEGIMPYW